MIFKFFVLFLLNYNLSVAQQTFIYKPSVDIDYKSIEINSVKKMMRNVESQLKKFEFVLNVNSNESFFYQSEVLSDESKNLQIIKVAEAMSYSKEEWFYDADKSHLILSTNVMNTPFSLKFDELPDWEIKNDTKRIGNYKVVKATTSRKFIGSKGVKEKEIEAWFCPDIPVPHGPMGAVGLPGLVIQLRLQNTIFTLDQVIEKDSLEIDEPDKSNTMPSKEFYTLIDQKVGDFKSSIQN